MAFFGIDSAGQSISATTLADTIALNYATTATVSATTVKGLDGGDIISLGAQGLTSEATGTLVLSYGALAVGSGGFSGTISGSYSGSIALIGSATYTTASTGTWSGSTGATVALTYQPVVSGVVTSERGARSLVASQLYGNAGNDSIAFGESLTTFSASTIGGGAGNDVIGSYTYVNSVWTQAKVVTAATYKLLLLKRVVETTPSNSISVALLGPLTPFKVARVMTLLISAQLLLTQTTHCSHLAAAMTSSLAL